MSTRFFVALLPPIAVQTYANQVIAELGDRYGTRTSYSPPHITLQPPFLWPEADRAQLHASLQRVAQQQAPVPIALSGFGSFPPRVLYISVTKTPALLALQSAIATQLQTDLQLVDPQAARRGYHPHLTVASRHFTPTSFRHAWAEVRQRPVEFQFISDRLTLLIYHGQQWHIETEWPLTRAPSGREP